MDNELIIEEHKIKDIQDTKLNIIHNNVRYDKKRKNIDIIDEDLYSNKYTIDLGHYWFSDYNKKESTLKINLRKCIPGYETTKASYYIITKDCDICDDLKTDWGDYTIDEKTKHIYEEKTQYDIISSGFINTKEHMHIGKYITKIDNINPSIKDASWLYSECYYALDSSFFPKLDTAKIYNMSYMFYNCARLRRLDLSEYDTSSLLNTSHMFDCCMNLIQLNLNNFNLDLINKDEYIEDMFRGCINLCELRLDDCKGETIKKIIESRSFPTNKILNEQIFEELYSRDVIKYSIENKSLDLESGIVENFEENKLILNPLYLEYNQDNKNLYMRKKIDSLNRLRKIYCSRSEIQRLELEPPENWEFIFINI